MKIEDKKIFKLALVTSVVGLVLMTIFAGQITPREVKIKDINNGMIDQEVSVEGVVVDVTVLKKTYIMRIVDDTGKLDVVIFDKTREDFEKYNLKIKFLINRRINVLGTVEEYNGRFELIIKDSKSIKVLS